MAINTRFKFTDGALTVYSDVIVVSGTTYVTYGPYTATVSSLSTGRGEWGLQYEGNNGIRVKEIAVADTTNPSQFLGDRATREIRKAGEGIGYHDIETIVFYKTVNMITIKGYVSAREE